MDTTSVEQIAERVEEELARLKAARPALSSRISRAEHILVTHLSCRRQRIIRVRISGDGRARFLVQGSGGAVYVVDPQSWQCSCPDAHRRGKGCKHGIACWALERASHGRPAPTPEHNGRRCGTEPKITRHDATSEARRVEEGLEHVGSIIKRAVPNFAEAGAARAEARAPDTHEERDCVACLEGLVYDGQAGSWVACPTCEGSGRALVFVYQKLREALRECDGCGARFRGRDLYQVGDDSLSYFEGEEICSGCALDCDGTLY